ncbi:hypothetical protein K469DRAFT_629639 [Zopfia rhizophila CBS 207.26]|uniref:Uncharacterized protein n=1 Tax=Zopfia rhizophila CBS 207.26 TaxID=1314779 RepID=A0A6A6E4Q8_9PEZI|nr:hypothetical protein K469DRAFT_629639 [Zopfia rhizophila CBS 207.26]
MYQRHICPSMGAIRRHLTQDIAATGNCSSRTFHLSAKRLKEDGPKDQSSTPGSSESRETRRTRSASAFKKVTGLQNKPLGIGRAGVFPRGQFLRKSDDSNGNDIGSAPGHSEGDAVNSRPLVRKHSVGPGKMAIRRTPTGASPPGTMVRAPTTLRINRNARGPATGGPNLRGREGFGPRPTRTVNRGTESGPKRRERKKESEGPMSVQKEDKIEDRLSDGMVQQLLRLQRKEWDRVSYEPMYSPGSKAATELLEAGKKLFEGEFPTKKKPGRLEHVLGIQNMHGA